jgi:hypothetical protein
VRERVTISMHTVIIISLSLPQVAYYYKVSAYFYMCVCIREAYLLSPATQRERDSQCVWRETYRATADDLKGHQNLRQLRESDREKERERERERRRGRRRERREREREREERERGERERERERRTEPRRTICKGIRFLRQLRARMWMRDKFGYSRFARRCSDCQKKKRNHIRTHTYAFRIDLCCCNVCSNFYFICHVESI